MTDLRSSAPRTSYRPDIDGLRSIAVVSVLLFHSKVAFLSGGFVGVDVFFVLTGFLITSVIDREIRSGTFSFQKFYLRRMRRILPAMLVVVGVTTVAAFLLLLPDDLLAHLASLKLALLSISNLYFWRNTGGYFQDNAEEMPLLHTWTLGVEEQFYLFWPLVLIVGLRVLPHRAWVVTFFCGLALSLGLSELAAVRHPNAAYYLLPTRAYEIMLGAVPVVLGDRIPALSKRLQDALSIVGVALIGGSVLLLSGKDRFPGLNGLWPCLGTLCLVMSGKPSGDRKTIGVVSSLLSWRPFVAVGLVSYSVYLWHWPILAFLTYRGWELRGAVLVLALFAPFALAVPTYYLIEQPFRFRFRLGFGKAGALLVVLPACAGLLLSAHAVANQGFPGRFAAIAELRRSTAKAYGRCEPRPEVGDVEHCSIGEKKEKLDGLIIGDSYADMYVNFMDVLAKDAGMYLHYSSNSVTPPILDVSAGPRPVLAVAEYNRRRIEMAARYRFVVLISSWDSYGEQNRTNRIWDTQGHDQSTEADRLQIDTIDWLVSRGVRPIFVDRPLSPPLRARMARMRAAKQDGISLEGHRQEIVRRPEDYFLTRMKARYPSAIFIHPSDVLCDATRCDLEIDGTLIYREDGRHLNATASALLGRRYLAQRPNPLKGLAQEAAPAGAR